MARRDPVVSLVDRIAREVWRAVRPAFAPSPRAKDLIPGLRVHGERIVAEGGPAASEAVTLYYNGGGTAPTEITMVAELAARYGAQVVFPTRPIQDPELVLLVPKRSPEVVGKVAAAAGYLEVPGDARRPYVAWAWSSDQD